MRNGFLQISTSTSNFQILHISSYAKPIDEVIKSMNKQFTILWNLLRNYRSVNKDFATKYYQSNVNTLRKTREALKLSNSPIPEIKYVCSLIQKKIKNTKVLEKYF